MYPPRGLASDTRARGVRSERGSGTVLGMALFCVLVLCASLTIPTTLTLGARAEMRALADSVALSGARVLAGLAPGEPCEVARSIAESNGVSLSSCRLGETDVRVTVSRIVGGVNLQGVASAGFLLDDTRDSRNSARAVGEHPI
ncbi:Rv3654c family TadE-like protein [Mycetocola saprophilus]|uniref:Rv3654c family TadE-like protein n=1 Tax=Mycetocola saprophilus TaxID=76636 RepID=UPI003BF3FF6D